MSALTHNIRTICLYNPRAHIVRYLNAVKKFPVSFIPELFFTFISRQCAYWYVLSSFVQILSRFLRATASQLPRPDMNAVW